MEAELQDVTLVLVGFGSVNRAFARLVAREAHWLASEHRLRAVFGAVIARHGAWVADRAPMSAAAVGSLADAVAGGSARLDGSTPPPEGVDALATPSVAAIRDVIAQAASGGLGCIVEAIDVDYAAGEPASTYLRDALSHGMHAVSANKGPVVHQRAALLSAAEAAGRRYLHESAVMDGVPIFSAWRGGFLPGGARLRRFRGALNSTTSVVLSGMERGQTMEEALRVAQEAGIAEADPTGDLSGMDAAVKVVALAVALELSPAPFCLSDVAVSGVEGVTAQAVQAATARGEKLRLVAGAEAAEGGGAAARGYVRVESLAPGDPLFGLQGADAAVTLYTDRLAPVTIAQQGSVVEDTAFGAFADLLRACRPAPP